MIKQALSFDDVLLVPQKSNVMPRETDVRTRLTRRVKLNIPILSSPMDTVTEYKMAIAIAKQGGLGIIHKNMTIDEQVLQIKRVKKENLKIGAAISVGDEQFDRAFQLVKAGVDVIVIDTAHGHSDAVIKMIKRIKTDDRFSQVDIIAGNVVTDQGAYDLILAGADAVKVGIGPGSICTTRIVTGVGVPQITAIKEALRGRQKSKKIDIPIIADGGIKFSGDLAKALAAGADCVMIGSLFAGTDESPGKIVKLNNQKYKVYRGMGSLEAMQNGSKDRYGQGKMENKKLVPEGVFGLVPYKGAVKDIIYQLTGGLRSSLGYLGAHNIREFQNKAKFVEISGAGLRESHPHSLSQIKPAVNYKFH
ncbi:MAG: IMP dehydrogenase [Patescibacteria group bacterium]